MPLYVLIVNESLFDMQYSNGILGQMSQCTLLLFLISQKVLEFSKTKTVHPISQALMLSETGSIFSEHHEANCTSLEYFQSP